MSIAFFGEALYDCYSELPPPDPAHALVLHANIGGGVLNAAVGAKRWLKQSAHSPLPVAFIGGISSDVFGRRILDLLHNEQISSEHCNSSLASTAVAIVVNDRNGERSFAFHRHRTADLDYPQSHWDAQWFDDIALFACDTNCMTTEEIFASNITALDLACNSHTAIAMDVNLRPALWSDSQEMRSRIRRALCYATLVKFSAEELSLVFSSNDEEHHITQLFSLPRRSSTPRVLCVSRGQEGCTVYFEGNRAGGPIHIKAPQTEVVDTTGAGDALFGVLCASIALHPLTGGRADHAVLRTAATEATNFATHTVRYGGALTYSVPTSES